LACARYTGVTGDFSVFDESVPYLSGRMLSVGEESYYDLPGSAAASPSLYQHCVRAIEHGLRFGVHGLPLMGSGDWNDGMNLVGIEGKGESVWLGFFLYHVLNEFIPICTARGDAAFAQRCEQAAALLRKNIEASGWDGAWYRRAYFDDGAPLGASENLECSIDSIAQSWSVLSGAGDKARAQSAMQALDQRLVRRDAQLVQLLDPPFDPSAYADQRGADPRGADQRGASQHPGYIAGYVPGVRENGGLYTHAAIWAAMAFAKLGDHSKAWELLNMINPINHSNSPGATAIYKAEPYVVAADVYAVAPHVGRGGWSWYTGSAGWLYRLMLESLLGLQRVGDHLSIMPCLPASWNNYSMRYRFGTTSYQINITRQAQPSNSLNPPNTQYRLDGFLLADEFIVLIDDGKEHVVEVGF
jgi:cyclic beta-1,2-glucan synthetase